MAEGAGFTRGISFDWIALVAIGVEKFLWFEAVAFFDFFEVKQDNVTGVTLPDIFEDSSDGTDDDVRGVAFFFGNSCGMSGSEEGAKEGEGSE